MMAFLGIGRKKQKQLPPLDVPPNPPKNSDLGSLPELPSLQDLPTLPEMPTPKQDAKTIEPTLSIGQQEPAGLKPLPELDSPPMPPTPPKNDLGKLPELPSLQDLPPLPELPKEAHIEPEMPETTQALSDPVTDTGLEDISIPVPAPQPRAKPAEPLPSFDRSKYEHMNEPLFVKSSDYKQVISGINTVKSRVKEVDTIFENIQRLKKEKEKQFEQWRTLMSDVQRKLVYVDKTLFEA